MEADQITSYWAKTKPSANWWTHRAVVRDYNLRVCGKPLDVLADGIKDFISTHAPHSLRKGISVGCGTGVKEIELVKSGVVDIIEGYDLAPDRIEVANVNARKAGVGDRAIFFCENVFEKFTTPSFNLIYWNNALHHMPDVRQSVIWSSQILLAGGVFAMDEYVGPNRSSFRTKNSPS